MQGRFASPDEFTGGPDDVSLLGSGDPEKQALPYADITNPQSINKYQYVYNNPLRYVDPDGHVPCCEPASLAQDRDIKELASGKITKEEYDTRQKARATGALVGLAVLGGIIVGPRVAIPILAWAARNPDKVQQVGQEALQMASGNPAPAPGLMIAANTRLRPSEIVTGIQFAKQAGLRLIESGHVGEEVYAMVKGVKKTFDFMGVAAAYKHPNFKLTEFYASIEGHLLKSVDYVVIDLRGATKQQIEAIQIYVSRLSKAQRDRIWYVSP